MPTRIVLDVDTGIDDALAIAYAVRSPELDVLGITTGFGNISANEATLNTCYVLEKLGVNIPVAQGAVEPLFHPRIKAYSTHFHGENGLANLKRPQLKLSPLPTHGASFLVEQVTAHPHEVVIVCVGSLTNMALAIIQKPEIVKLVKKIVIMGGAISVPGNNQMHAEANIYADPEAADYVFRSGAPITLVGLDVTMQTALTMQEIEQWKTKDTELSRFLAEITTFYIGSYRKFYKDRDYCALHDPLAVAVAIDSSMINSQPMYVRVDLEGVYSYGRTIADFRVRSNEVPNMDVAVEVDVARFTAHFLRTVC